MKKSKFIIIGICLVLTLLTIKPSDVTGGEVYYDFNEKINTVKEREEKLEIKTNQLIACDTHFDRFKDLSEVYPTSVKMMNYVNKTLKSDFAVIMGDYISELGQIKENKTTLEGKYKSYRNLLSPNTLIVKGNHDDTTYENGKDASQVASTATLWKYAMEGKKGIRFHYKDPMGYYYYKDDYESKVRHIFLNTVDIPYNEQGTNDYMGGTDWGMRQEQLNWFANVALIVPNEWEVCVYSHHSMQEGVTPGDIEVKNRDVALKILKDFKAGSATTNITSNTTGDDKTFDVNVSTDFKNQGSKKVVAWFFGHHHFDCEYKIDDVNHIGLPAMKYFNGDNIEKRIGRTGEGKEIVAFDIMQIDKKNSKMFLTRFGFGKDREFTY